MQYNRQYSSGPSHNANFGEEAIDETELFMGYDDQVEVDNTGRTVNVPVELQVPSQIQYRVPIASNMRSSFERPISSLPPGSGSITQPLHIHPRQAYVWGLPGVPGEERVDAGDRSQGQVHIGMVNSSGVYTTPTAYQEQPHRHAYVQNPGHTSGSYQLPLHQVPPIGSSIIAQSELRRFFPLDDDDHRGKRDALNRIMQSTWKQDNEFEPDHSLLMQFMLFDPNEGRWHCTFWKDGRPCACSCRKRDHAKGHIRSHIDLLPFVCDSQCPYSTAGCGKRYPAVEPLQKHRKGKTECEYCALPVLPTNMKRHIQTSHQDLISRG